MPELPEAEFGRRMAAEAAVGRQIVAVRCQPDPIVFCGRAPEDIERALLQRTVVAACRRGKYIWFELDRGPHPVFHFGMTGAFRVRGVDPLKLASHGKQVDDAWPPRFEKIGMAFDDGGELVMTNARRLGRIRLVERPLSEPPLVDLGFDPLTDMPSLPAFRGLVAGRTAVLKSLLLDQRFSAGVGNWIADEVLYQAGIDPRRRVSSLDTGELKRLHARLRGVVRQAVAVDARKDRFPRSWLFHYRWGKGADARDHGGSPIEFVEIGGRTTAWVPARQR
ncbi:MAG: hypothetical protein B7733_11050 [Myxococcales bacterium FL481]|nr:MAG: hypothetical protein B7733_11050 [Myxococcales bacterium FL481]